MPTQTKTTKASGRQTSSGVAARNPKEANVSRSRKAWLKHQHEISRLRRLRNEKIAHLQAIQSLEDMLKHMPLEKDERRVCQETLEIDRFDLERIKEDIQNLTRETRRTRLVAKQFGYKKVEDFLGAIDRAKKRVGISI